MNEQSSISVLVAVILLAIILIVKWRKGRSKQRIKGNTESEMKDLMANEPNEASMDIENAGSISGSCSTSDQDIQIEQEHVCHSDTSSTKTAEDSLPQRPSQTQNNFASTDNTHVLQSEMVIRSFCWGYIFCSLP